MDKDEELNIFNITINDKTYYLYPINKLPATTVIAMMGEPSPENFHNLLYKAAFVEDTKELLKRISFGDLMELAEAYMSEWYKQQEAKEAAKEKEKKRWFKRLD